MTCAKRARWAGQRAGACGRFSDSQKEKEETLIVEDAPIVKIVATIVRYAVEGNASDVHIEHMRDKIRVHGKILSTGQGWDADAEP